MNLKSNIFRKWITIVNNFFHTKLARDKFPYGLNNDNISSIFGQILDFNIVIGFQDGPLNTGLDIKEFPILAQYLGNNSINFDLDPTLYIKIPLLFFLPLTSTPSTTPLSSKGLDLRAASLGLVRKSPLLCICTKAVYDSYVV